MVLNELGSKLNNAFRSLMSNQSVDSEAIEALLKEVCNALLASDVNLKQVVELKKKVLANLDKVKVSGMNKKKLVQKAVVDELVNLVDPKKEAYQPVKGKSNIIMFVGLQGCGKTTTCTKLAYYYQRKGWKTGLVCADTFRAGAFDQLKQNATKAKIPFYGSYEEADPVSIALEGVEKFKSENYELIIVDTSGRHKQEIELFNEMTQISNCVKPNNIIFVMDGNIGQAAHSQAMAFKDVVSIGSVIMTKMDGHGKGGGAISAVAATNSPIIFVGTGEHIHDLEKFSARSFINKLLGLGDLTGLFETVTQANPDLEKDSKELFNKISSGQFHIRDMYKQFQSISKLGPINKILGMMPGMSPEMLQMFDSHGGQDKMKILMAIMDSMTSKELDSEGELFEKQPTRVKRIAMGSGASKQDVQDLLTQYKEFAKMMKSLGGNKGLMNNLMKNPAAMGKSPQGLDDMMSKMSSMMGGGDMASMLGGNGMQDMMSQMMQGGGMQDMMSKMMQGMGSGGMPDLSAMFGGATPSSSTAAPLPKNRAQKRMKKK